MAGAGGVLIEPRAHSIDLVRLGEIYETFMYLNGASYNERKSAGKLLPRPAGKISTDVLLTAEL